VYVTLFMQTTRPLTEIETFRPAVRMVSTYDNVSRAQRNTSTYRGVSEDWWQPDVDVVVERFALTTTSKIPIGTYRLEVFAVTQDAETILPIYQGADTATLDKVVLGYVAVPWQGEIGPAEPVGANLGNQITLLGFEAADSLSAGKSLDVTLYWEAQRPPDDDYVVFVHLVDGEGRLAGSSDGRPMDGRYATQAWLPGEVVPDAHRLALDPALPAGTYRLQVGMYAWPSLERLQVWDSQGVEQPDRAVVLQDIEVR
jgi:hypothetical protein